VTRHAQRAPRPWGPALAAGGLVAALVAGGAAWALTREVPERTPATTSGLLGSAPVTGAEGASASTAPVGTHAPGWVSVRADARERLGAAEQLLAATAGRVDDESLRVATERAAAELATALDGAPASPGLSVVVAVSSAAAALAAASDRLAQAHETWVAARAAEDEARRSSAAAAARWVGTADCGVPGPEGIPARDAATTLYTSVPAQTGDGSNGHLPRSAMVALAWCTDSQGHQQWLRADAAAALTSLNEAFRARFGENIAVDLSYRSYDDQVRAQEIFGRLAATPGTSDHGLGTAIDTWESDYYDFGSERFEWLVAHGPEHGWVCPAATERGNTEYWHFEYTG
jgi:hypothetical protein